MVFYSQQALLDLEDVRFGLLYWKKIELNYTFILSYIEDIFDICNSLDKKMHHFDTTFPSHKKYGQKVHRYRRNPNTTWYIIYDIDRDNNVCINKIISNYMTIEEQE